MTKTKTFIISLLLLSLTAQAQTPKAYFGTTPPLKVSGKEIVDPNGKAVTLHGVMDTPSPYFNNYRWTGGQWADIGHNGDNYVDACKNYFDKIFTAITDTEQGAFCNLFRLHLDPCWTNDPNKTATNGGGENDISRFSAERLEKYLESLYVPIALDAISHGLYVIIRPPGVFPADVAVGDAYNDFLLTVWDIISKNKTLKQYSGQISFELGNEPITIKNSDGSYGGHLANYFQPIVDRIRQNGFDGIIWLPGTGYQAFYCDYENKQYSFWKDGVITTTGKEINDPQNNMGFAVHCYPGWYGSSNNEQTEVQFVTKFEEDVPVVKTHPIVITEIDWSPGCFKLDENGNKINKNGDGNYETTNYGSWGTGTTSATKPANVEVNSEHPGFGARFKHLVDTYENISWTLEGTDQYIDVDRYLASGSVVPAFYYKMRADKYSDAYEASSGAAFVWFREWACGERLPNPNAELTISEPTEIQAGSNVTNPNAEYDAATGRYYFKYPISSAFTFDNVKGYKVKDVAELTIVCDDNANANTFGYRLDFKLKKSDGTVTDYILGTEEAGTRSESVIGTHTYDIQTILAKNIKDDEDVMFEEIRINSAVPWDAAKQAAAANKEYYITLNGFKLLMAHASSKKFSRPVNLDELTFIEPEGTGFRFGESQTNGAVVAGVLNGSVPKETYIDLSRYTTMEIEGTGGELRLIYNKYQPGDNLTKGMFHEWDNYGSGASIVTPEHWLEVKGLKTQKDSWEQQIHIALPTALEGGVYNLSFDVKGDEAQNEGFVIWGTMNTTKDANGTETGKYQPWYNGGKIPVTTEWNKITQNYTWETQNGLREIDFNFGQYAGTELYFDNIKITKVVNNEETEVFCLDFDSNNSAVWSKPSGWGVHDVYTAAIAKSKDEISGAYDIGKSSDLPYGDVWVKGCNYADLSEYNSLALTVTDGIPRLLFNRQGMDNSGDFIEINSAGTYATAKGQTWTIDLDQIKQWNNCGYAHLNAIKGANNSNVTITSALLIKSNIGEINDEIKTSLSSGSATIDLKQYQDFRLNSIKADWGQTVNVHAIRLYNGAISDIEADYHLTGAGYQEQPFENALADANATVIDITGMTNTVKQNYSSDNPNCLFVQTTNNTFSNEMRNLVTVNNNEYSAAAISLEDGHAFRTPVDITTDNATYSRTLTTQWGTATLPFSFTVTNTTPQVFRLKDVSDGKMTFKRIPVNETIPANTPILYYNPSIGETTFSGQNIQKTIDGWNAQPIIKEDNSTVNGWYVCQSMTDKVIENVATDNFFKDYDVYVINKDNFILATKKLTSKTFRAFFLHRKDGTGNAPATSFSIAIEDDINGISDASVDKHAIVTERYDASGRRINTPVRGVNIIRMSDGSVRKVLK